MSLFNIMRNQWLKIKPIFLWIGRALFIFSMLVIYAIAEYWPEYVFLIRIVVSTISVMISLGLLGDILNLKKEDNRNYLFYIGMLGYVLLIPLSIFLFTDWDDNHVINYTEIAYGLNPFVQDTNQNSDPATMRNLIDGCIVDYLKKGKVLDYSHLPIDSDGDGCFDIIEAFDNSVNSPGNIPAHITTQYSNPENAYINGFSNTKTLILSNDSTDSNLLEFVWDKFIFNDEKKPIEEYSLSLSLEAEGKEKKKYPETFTHPCINDSLIQNKSIQCRISQDFIKQITDFIKQKDEDGEVNAHWNVKVGKLSLFTSDQEYHNYFTISLKL